MACISKIKSAVAYDCESGNVGFVNAILINRADITSYVLSDGAVTALNIGADTYKIDTVKRSLTVAESIRVNEGAPNGFVHEVGLTVYAKTNTALINALRNSNVVILTDDGNGIYRAFGLFYGLNATAATGASHENGGWITFTLSTPEGVVGEDYVTVQPALYDTTLEASL